MNSKIAIVGVFAVAVIVILILTLRAKDPDPSATTPSAVPSEIGAKPASTEVTEISMIYSTEKKDWIEAALVLFKKDHPEIKVTLVGKGSLDSAQSILDGKDKPTLWSPADTLVLKLLESDWETKNHSELFAKSGDDAPQPEVITPLVFVAWEDRAQALIKSSKSGRISWSTIHKAVGSNEGWPAAGGKKEWGFVKLGHTDPTRSNSGMQALYLMTLEYYERPSVAVGDLLDPKYQAFVGAIEKGVGKFETSTGSFMTDMVRFGPSKYDIAVVYENLAIGQLENAQGRWGNLKVYYPSTTLWSDHPVALLQGDWVTEPQKKAARTWIAHLRSRSMQEKALTYGFRPADTAVPIKTADAQNPFTRLAQYGLQIDIPTAAQAPDGLVVRNLLTMWSRVVPQR
jgi:hypothetical protein